jgi:C-terminal processing protease CtpA/Prc
MTKNQSSDVIIDMRENGGGDLYVGLILAHGLNLVDGIDWLHGVNVLTGANTFSAGASNAALFRELLNARIVGMPTGSNPTGYQDMDEFSLHHSKLRVTYSKRLFRLQETPTEGVIPDVLVMPKWSDYQQGIDTAITEILMQ